MFMAERQDPAAGLLCLALHKTSGAARLCCRAMHMLGRDVLMQYTAMRLCSLKPAGGPQCFEHGLEGPH